MIEGPRIVTSGSEEVREAQAKVVEKLVDILDFYADTDWRSKDKLITLLDIYWDHYRAGRIECHTHLTPK